MNTSKLILSFSCGKVNFSRSILLFKRGFYMSEEMEVACLLCLSDDKSSAETFWVVCQMTNRPQRRFEPFVRWQIVLRGVLGREVPPPQEKWRFESISILEFCLKGYFYGLPRWRSQWRVKVPFGFSLSPPWISQTPSILRIAPLLEEWNRRGFSSVA
mgnify:CR=1 FL=1